MDEAHKGYGIHVVIRPSRGSIRVFSRADILQAVQTVAEAAVHLFGYYVRLPRNAKAVSAASTTGIVYRIVSKSRAIPVRGLEQTCC